MNARTDLMLIRRSAAAVAIVASLACAPQVERVKQSSSSRDRCLDVLPGGSLVRDSMARMIFLSPDLLVENGRSSLLLGRFAYAFSDKTSHAGGPAVHVDSIGGVLLDGANLSAVLPAMPISSAWPASAVAIGPDRWQVVFIDPLDTSDSLSVPRVLNRSQVYLVALQSRRWGAVRAIGTIDYLLGDVTKSTSVALESDGSLLIAMSFSTPFPRRNSIRRVHSGVQLTYVRSAGVNVDTLVTPFRLDKIRLAATRGASSRLAVVAQSLVAQPTGGAPVVAVTAFDLDGRARRLFEPSEASLREVQIAEDDETRWLVALTDPGGRLLLGELAPELDTLLSYRTLASGIEEFDFVARGSTGKALLSRTQGGAAPLELRLLSGERERTIAISESDETVGPDPRIRFIDDSTMLIVSTAIRGPSYRIPAGLRLTQARIRC